MGQIEIRGHDAEDFVNGMLTYDVRRLKRQEAHYALLCYQDGGIVDDLIVYKLATSSGSVDALYYFFAVNAANRQKDAAWLRSHASRFDVEVRDVSDETYMLAFQGPLAAPILNGLTQAELYRVARFSAANDTLFGHVPVLLGRTGYTGEDGFELFFPAEYALEVWEGILKAGAPKGVEPIGLAARDSLRFEPCMPLYGQEIGPERSPIEARLKYGISLDKDFVGRDALLKQDLEGTAATLVGFEMIERGVPRHGYSVICDSVEVGKVTSGMYSPTTDRYLGMAYVPGEMSQIGTDIEVIIHSSPHKAHIVRRPFYVPGYRR
jgi:aminomethyltransferase